MSQKDQPDLALPSTPLPTHMTLEIIPCLNSRAQALKAKGLRMTLQG